MKGKFLLEIVEEFDMVFLMLGADLQTWVDTSDLSQHWRREREAGAEGIFPNAGK